jgi:hypothetical protein
MCVIDPTGVWWGMRLLADGCTAAYPVVIFGGVHADLDITEGSEARLARIIAAEAFSCFSAKSVKTRVRAPTVIPDVAMMAHHAHFAAAATQGQSHPGRDPYERGLAEGSAQGLRDAVAQITAFLDALKGGNVDPLLPAAPLPSPIPCTPRRPPEAPQESFRQRPARTPDPPCPGRAPSRPLYACAVGDACRDEAHRRDMANLRQSSAHRRLYR